MPGGGSPALSYTTANVLNRKRVKLSLPLFSEKETLATEFWSNLSTEEQGNSINSSSSQQGHFVEERRIGSELVWGIAGPVKEFWEKRLAPQIEAIQSKYGRRIFQGNDQIREVGCWMIGPMRENVIPTVVIVSGDKKFNKRLAKHISRDGVFKASGFRLRAIPTWVTSAAELAVDSCDLMSDGSWHIKQRKGGLNAPIKVNFGTSFVSVSKDGDQEAQRAVMGGPIAIDDHIYGLTVAHVFQKNGHSSSSSNDKNMDSLALYDPLADSEGEGNGNDDTTEHFDDDDDFYDDEAVANLVAHDVYLEDVSLPRNLGKRLGIFEPIDHNRSDNAIGAGRHASLDLDWSIFSLDMSQGFSINRNFVDGDGNIGTVNKTAPCPPPGNTAILRCGYAVDVIQKSKAFTLLSMPGSQSMQRAYILDFCCDPGNCGAWVIDPRSGDAYGVIVANSRSLGLTYYLPLQRIFDSISYAWDGASVNLAFDDLNSGRSYPSLRQELSKKSHSREELSQFRAWLGINAHHSSHTNDTTRTTDSDFIASSDLRKYFDSIRLNNVLEEIHPFGIPRSVNVASIQRNYLQVLAILLSIGKGVEISRFINESRSLADCRLPFSRFPPKDFPNSIGDQDLFPMFYQQQWKFCPPVMTYNKLKEWPPEYTLPIVSKIPLNDGKSSRTFKVQLHPEFNKLRAHRVNDLAETDPDFNTFVLKTYSSREFSRHEKEIEALLRFRDESHDSSNIRGLVGFYGSFKHNDTFNVILEHANQGNLEEYFNSQAPPNSSEQRFQLWKSMFRLFHAVMDNHDNLNSNKRPLQGWHQDISPRNILVVNRKSQSPYEWKFLLADFGLSHFETRSGLKTGTSTYECPECFRAPENTLQQKYDLGRSTDIFSFGCILSEIVTWVVKGLRGSHSLEEYRHNRTQDGLQLGNLNNLGRFHDGNQILPSVKRQHDALRKGIKKDDITLQVLELADRTLLPCAPLETARSFFRGFAKLSRKLLRYVESGKSTCSSIQNMDDALFAKEIQPSNWIPIGSASLAQDNTSLTVVRAPQQPLDRSDFRIAIVCSLEPEFSAVQAVFDETWDPAQYGKADNDPNSYALGKIGRHNIVLAYLPDTSRSAARTLTPHFLPSYQSITFMLDVGKCKEAPLYEIQERVRLGDVVISNNIVPDMFERGSTYRQRKTDSSMDLAPQPNKAILTFIRMLETSPNRQLLREGMLQSLKRPLEDEDRTEWKRNLSKISPAIQFGKMGSANKVMNSEVDRDTIIGEEHAVAFEMEGAGNWDTVPTIIIRSICDLADSHDRAGWQKYASATAACLAKAVLATWTPTEAASGLGVDRRLYKIPFCVERKNVPNFVGREAEMAKLKQWLVPDSTSRRMCKIYGLGGIGKTQLALNFAYEQRDCYDSIIWLDGSTESSLKKSFSEFGSRMYKLGMIAGAQLGGSSDAIIEDALSWLSLPDNRNWLLILDNVDRDPFGERKDEQAYDPEEFFPRASHGAILITTRLSNLFRHGRRRRIDGVNNEEDMGILEIDMGGSTRNTFEAGFTTSVHVSMMDDKQRQKQPCHWVRQCE